MTYTIVKNSAGAPFIASNSIKRADGAAFPVDTDVRNAAGTVFPDIFTPTVATTSLSSKSFIALGARIFYA